VKPLADVIFDEGFDVTGRNLIEASAGTGKTYSIQTLFLRLVAAEGLAVDSILVVTFTEAATKELRERLRAIIEKCRLYLGRSLAAGDADEERIKEVLELARRKGVDAEVSLRRIRRALLNFDQAAIYTIHGFCQRTLQEFAFECGHDFDVELINGEDRLQEHCRDWWRRISYGESRNLSANLLKESNPKEERLTALVKEIAKRHEAIVLPDEDRAVNDSLIQKLDATTAFLITNRSIISGDIKTGYDFFSESEIKEIEELFYTLSNADSSDSANAFDTVKKIAGILNGSKRPNLYNPPPDVELCLAACKKYQKTKKDSELFTAAAKLINRHYDAIKQFLKEDSRFYNKNDFTDRDKLRKHLDVLKSQADEKELKKSFTQLCKLKKSAKIPWYCCDITEQFRKHIADLVSAGTNTITIEEVIGAKAVLAEYRKAKRDAYEMTFDDMLQNVEAALAGPEGSVLREALRAKYSSALIDEFQDTDQVQYNIFKNIFGSSEVPLFYVGDPKQAIYSFRGGDIFTYSAAVNEVEDSRKFSLNKNYRSQKKLIDAVNTIFKDRQNSDGESLPVFLTPNISYSGKLKCQGLETQFVIDDKKDITPFKIWNYRHTGEGKKKKKDWAVYEDVANEVASLLNNPATGFMKESDNGRKFKRLQPSDIAILVKRHAEAAIIYRALRRRGVRVVRQSGDKIFSAPEAMEMLYLLKAMVNPEKISAVKTALASELISVSDIELTALERGEKICGDDDLPSSMEKWIELFKASKELWLRKNFSAAFSYLSRKININATLAALPMGERRFVNVQQLHDLIHKVSQERHLGLEGVIKWFNQQLDSDSRDNDDAFETILESDDNAVKIMTIFKSKGLEFPIVFVPTMWTGVMGQAQAECRIYHDHENRTVINFDKENKEAKSAAQKEKKEEEVRNLYVAVTRASHRTYLIAGDLGGRDSMLSECICSDLMKSWKADADNGIEIIDKDFAPDGFLKVKSQAMNCDSDLNALQADVDLSRGHASFSSIAPKGHGASVDGHELHDFDGNDIESGKGIQSDDIEEDELNILSFAAGARTGECWHRIFELLDFGADDRRIKETVAEQLALFGQDSGNEAEADQKRKITVRMVKNVLQAEMQVEGHELIKLADISEADKLAEMAFDFSLVPIKAGDGRNAIFEVLAQEWGDAADDSEEKIFLGRLKEWQTEIPGGFMTGFIDLVFRKNGKYYILDWKSNCLSRNPENFKRKGLVQEMATHSYFLQYLIYCAALHRYLGQCIENYDYNTHFGGALYIFLRGVDQTDDKQSQNGIFYTKPKKQLIENLAAALMGTANPH